jgi:3D (Asp-Asp-Asp) domain-containing protein
MKKQIKFLVTGAFIGSSLLSFAAGANAASFDDVEVKAQQQADMQAVLEQPADNCLQMFAGLYLQLLEQQYAVRLKEMNASASSAANLKAQTVANTSPVKPIAASQNVSKSAEAGKPAAKKETAKPHSAEKTVRVASAASGKVSTSSGSLSYSRMLNVTASAYSASPEENGGYAGLDYFGNALKVGSIAVDPNVIPLGTKVFITGYSYNGLPAGGMIATAVDTGSAIKGKCVDIFTPGSKSQVSQFGYQNVKIYILK